jgi:hypothetical protein
MTFADQHANYLDFLADTRRGNEEEEPMTVHLFSCVSPGGMRIYAPDVRVLNRVRAALWPASPKTMEVKRG